MFNTQKEAEKFLNNFHFPVKSMWYTTVGRLFRLIIFFESFTVEAYGDTCESAYINCVANLKKLDEEWENKKERKYTTSLPVITDQMWKDFNETDLMTWDRSQNRPHWTQTAVDFTSCISIV